VNTDRLKHLWKIVFEDPDGAIDAFFAVAFSAERCRYIEEDGVLLSALYWLDCEYEGGKLAYIYAVATHPEHRGRGLASRLLEETHAHLKALGYAGAVLKPAKGLFPFYGRLGYETCGFVRRFHGVSASVPAEIQEISVAEYARLRRMYLPENGIVQEGVTLDYLHIYAKLYTSKDALFCVSREDPVIFEYLGNPDSAPGILAALDIPSADIPTAGKEIPFAMWHPLNCTKKPGYLGISLE